MTDGVDDAAWRPYMRTNNSAIEIKVLPRNSLCYRPQKHVNVNVSVSLFLSLYSLQPKCLEFGNPVKRHCTKKEERSLKLTRIFSRTCDMKQTFFLFASGLLIPAGVLDLTDSLNLASNWPFKSSVWIWESVSVSILIILGIFMNTKKAGAKSQPNPLQKVVANDYC